MTHRRSLLSLVLLLCGAATFAPAKAVANDCYLKETPRALLLGNSRLEIRIDPGNGAVTGLLNKTSGLQLLSGGSPEPFRLVYSTWTLHGAAVKDLWGAAYGTLVHGGRQAVSSRHFEPTPEGCRLAVAYDRLRLERRTINVAVRYTVELRAGDEETRWRISLQNRDEGTVREVHFPFASGLVPLDSLIVPNHSGQRLRNPVDELSDEVPLVALEYPARASMQWFEYFSPRTALYMASYDPGLAYTRLCFGRPGEGRGAAMWIEKYAFAASGSSWESPPLALGLHSGDWHWGADRYRSWLESWVRPPEVPKGIQEMVGGIAEACIKDMDGRVVHTYQDSVRVADGLRPAEPLLLYGWLYDGHDTYYPEYVPIPDLGGKAALVEAVDAIHRGGRLVSAYLNARLANNETETYRRNGKKWAVLTKAPGTGLGSLTFAELHENWNTSWERSKRSEGWFAVMCPAVKAWQDHLVAEASRILGEYRFDGLFVDQPGSFYAELCYNPNHGHSTPATAWGPGYLEMLRRIRLETRKLNPESFLWIEGMIDAYGQYVDYHLDKNPVWEPMRSHPRMETFPEMWRYTVPTYITVNDPHPYTFPPSKDAVYGENYKFVMAIRGIEKGDAETRAASEALRLERQAVVDKIARLWKKGGEFFFHGRFLDDAGVRASDPAVLAKSYRGEDALAIAVWNTRGEPAACELAVDLGSLGLAAAPAVNATSLDTGQAIPTRVAGHLVTTSLRLRPHDIDAVIVRGTRASAARQP